MTDIPGALSISFKYNVCSSQHGFWCVRGTRLWNDLWLICIKSTMFTRKGHRIPLNIMDCLICTISWHLLTIASCYRSNGNQLVEQRCCWRLSQHPGAFLSANVDCEAANIARLLTSDKLMWKHSCEAVNTFLLLPTDYFSSGHTTRVCTDNLIKDKQQELSLTSVSMLKFEQLLPTYMPLLHDTLSIMWPNSAT